MTCLDTSALMEIAQANPKFLVYAAEEFLLPDPILAEFASIMLRRYDERTTDYWYKRLQPFARPVDLGLWYLAAKFRWKSHRRKLSLFDAVVYAFAQRNRRVLVTADTDFRNLPGVKLIAK